MDLEPDVHSAPNVPHRRADVLIKDYLSGTSHLVDLKVINERAAPYVRKSPSDAAAERQRTSLATYSERTSRHDVRIWVMTVGGHISTHMSADLTFLAQSLHMPKQTLVARMYGAMLNAHAAVIDTYDKVYAKRMLR